MGNLIWEPVKVWRGDLHCLMSCVKCFCHLYSILSCHPVPWWVPLLCHWVSSDKKHNYICQAVWKFTFILAYFLWIALDGSSVLIRLSMWESFFVESLQLWHLDNLSRQGVLFSLPGNKQSINHTNQACQAWTEAVVGQRDITGLEPSMIVAYLRFWLLNKSINDFAMSVNAFNFELSRA